MAPFITKAKSTVEMNLSTIFKKKNFVNIQKTPCFKKIVDNWNIYRNQCSSYANNLLSDKINAKMVCHFLLDLVITTVTSFLSSEFNTDEILEKRPSEGRLHMQKAFIEYLKTNTAKNFALCLWDPQASVNEDVCKICTFIKTFSLFLRNYFARVKTVDYESGTV